MTKPTVTIERCQQIGHQLNLQVTLTCPVPRCTPNSALSLPAANAPGSFPWHLPTATAPRCAPKSRGAGLCVLRAAGGAAHGHHFSLYRRRPRLSAGGTGPTVPSDLSAPPGAAPLYPQQQKEKLKQLAGLASRCWLCPIDTARCNLSK